MQGFQPHRAMKKPAKNYANGGRVVGPGTGTSDDVEAEVPRGAYVMPADTTEAARGFKPGGVDVALSNGEQVLTPEQIYQVGVQTLNMVKAMTHEPVGAASQEEAREGEFGEPPESAGREQAEHMTGEDEDDAPRYGFANGGVVDDEKKKGFMARAFPGTTAALDQRQADINAAQQTGGVGAAVGQSLRTALVPAVGLADDVARGAKTLLDPAAQALKTAVTGDATPIGQEPKPAIQMPAAQTAPVGAVQRPAAPPVATAPAAPTQPAGFAPDAGNVTAQRQPNGVMSFSGENVTGPVSYNGAGAAGFTGKPSVQNMAAADAIAQRSMAGFQPGSSAAQADSQKVQPGQGLYVAPDTGGFGLLDKNRLRERELRMATTSTKSNLESQDGYDARIKGAASALQGFQSEQASAPRFAAEQAIRGREMDLRGQEVAQRGEDLRQARGFRAGQLANDTARTALEAKKVGSDIEARGFEVNQARRLDAIRQKYEAATDPKVKAELAQQLRTLSGKDEQANKFTVVPGGQEWDATAGVMRNVPGRVLNNQTGQFVDGAGGQKALPPLKDNPEAVAIYNDTSLSQEQRAAKIRALGYN
jgi:hypothetical protein